MDDRLSAAAILIESWVLVRRSWTFAVGWLVVFVTCSSTIDAMGLDQRLNSFLSVASLFGEFMITSAALRTAGLHHAWAKPGRAASFVGAGLITGIAILTGFLLLVVPAVFLYTRWVIVQPLIIGEGRTMGQAMVESWRRTASSTLSIMAALAPVLGSMIGGLILFVFMAPYDGPVPLDLVLTSNLLMYSGMIMAWYLAAAVHCLFETHRSTADAPDPDIGRVSA